MSDFGRGRSYPLNPKDDGSVKELTLEPNYPQLLRWHLNGMVTESFAGFEGRRAALHSILDITRYLAHKDPEALRQIMLTYEKGFGPVTVITAEGTGTGYLQADDSIRMVEDDHLEAEYEDRFAFDEEEHPDDPSLQDTEFDHADPSNQ